MAFYSFFQLYLSGFLIQVKFGDGRNLWQLFCFVAFFSWNGAPGENCFGNRGVF